MIIKDFQEPEMSADKYVMNKDGTVIDLETHQKDIASQEGGIAAQEEDAYEKATLASINRMKARVRSAREVMKARDRLAAEEDINRNAQNGMAAQFMREDEKEISDYAKRKEAFQRLIEERKALKQK